jgi:hypothetical protein
LRKDIETKPQDVVNVRYANPLHYEGHYGEKEKAERAKKEKERKQQWENEMKQDRDRVKRQIANVKKGGK